MDGRDEETMDMIVSDLKTAAHGLPVSFRVVPFDTPMIAVSIDMGDYDEPIGHLMFLSNELSRDGDESWWTMSLITMGSKDHGKSLRAALAHLLNLYIDKRVGFL